MPHSHTPLHRTRIESFLAAGAAKGKFDGVSPTVWRTNANGGYVQAFHPNEKLRGSKQQADVALLQNLKQYLESFCLNSPTCKIAQIV